MFTSDAPLRAATHKPGCAFGDGFYKVVHADEAGQRRVRVFATQAESDMLLRILPRSAGARAYRDACLDAPAPSDAGTPDVVDGEWWLGLPKAQAMAELGLTDERAYARVHRAVGDAVAARSNRQSQGGVRASVVIRRRRTAANAHLFAGGSLLRIRPGR